MQLVYHITRARRQLITDTFIATIMTAGSIYNGHQVHQPLPESRCSRLTGTE